MPFSSGPVVAKPNLRRPPLLVTGGQWGVLGLLLATIALEFVFSPYWRDFYENNLITGSGGKDKKLKVTQEGFMVMAFLVFGSVVILLLTGINQRAGLAIAGLLFLSVFLARAQPIIDWMDATSDALKKASGS